MLFLNCTLKVPLAVDRAYETLLKEIDKVAYTVFVFCRNLLIIIIHES